MLRQNVELTNPIIGDTTTVGKLEETYRITTEIIENLDDIAIAELYQGSQNDVDAIFDTIAQETYKSLYGNNNLVEESKFEYLAGLTASVEHTLRCESLAYFITSTIPQFELNWHHLEWTEMATMYNKLCLIAARDHGKSYFWSHVYPIWKMYRYDATGSLDRRMCQKGMLISNELDLCKDFIEQIQSTIEESPILAEVLMPDNLRDNWSATRIKNKNGTRLTIKSYGGSLRGRHPHWIVGDDLLKDNVLYSEVQRKKAWDWLNSVVMNALVPNGQIVVVGTPFHEADIYGELKKGMKRTLAKTYLNKRKSWFVFEYPSIYPNGKTLWPDRYSFDDLMLKREEQGNIIFSREHLVRPIVSDSSIFPWKLLQNAIINMDQYCLVDNRAAFPIKFNRVVVGVDLAISANVGADYTVFTTWGIDDRNHLWLLNVYRKSGASYMEQRAMLKTINANFSPDVIYVESNQYQMAFAQEADNDGLPVIPHNTGVNKYNLETGLPSLALLFERMAIHLPRGDGYSRNTTDIIMGELASITWTEKGKLEGVGMHDDTVMSIFMAKLASNHITTGFTFGFLD